MAFIMLSPPTMTVSDKINAVLALLAFCALIIALFQNAIHTWLVKPELNLKYNHKPPDCYMGLLPPSFIEEQFRKRYEDLRLSIHQAGNLINQSSDPQTIQQVSECKLEDERKLQSLDSEKNQYQCTEYYFRLRVENVGNSKAEQVEVFAKSLEEIEEKDEGETCRIVDKFIPINLNWTHTSNTLQNSLAQGTEKMCEIGRFIEPYYIPSDVRSFLELKENETAFWFSVGAQDGLLNYIISPGTYRLHLVVSAANARPKEQKLKIVIKGKFDQDIKKMLEENVMIKLLD